MKINYLIAISAIFLAFAVAFGAFGAHALRGKIDDYYLQVFEKAVFYHFIHTLGALILFLVVMLKPELQRLQWVGVLLICSTLVFSGSLYLLVLLEQKWLGAITPIGGLGFIVAWLLLAIFFIF